MGGPGFYKRGGGGWVSPMIAHRRPFPRKVLLVLWQHAVSFIKLFNREVIPTMISLC